MSVTLRPWRDYDEKDVINLYSLSGTLPATRGTLVKIVQGFKVTDEPIEMLGSPGASYNNTVSQRYGAYAKIARTDAGDAALGLLLLDVRETDENGEQLKFNPRKAAEMDTVISGQAVPVVRRGMFLYSGTQLASESPTFHTKLYAAGTGELTTGVVLGPLPGYKDYSGTNVSGVTSPPVGYCLGGKDTNGCVLIYLDI